MLGDFGQGIGEMNESATDIIKGITDAFRSIYTTVKPGAVAPTPGVQPPAAKTNMAAWAVGTAVVLGIGYMMYTAMSRAGRKAR